MGHVKVWPKPTNVLSQFWHLVTPKRPNHGLNLWNDPYSPLRFFRIERFTMTNNILQTWLPVLYQQEHFPNACFKPVICFPKQHWSRESPPPLLIWCTCKDLPDQTLTIFPSMLTIISWPLPKMGSKISQRQFTPHLICPVLVIQQCSRPWHHLIAPMDVWNQVCLNRNIS